MDAGIDTHRYAEENRKQRSRDGQFQRRRKSIGQDCRNRLFHLVGRTKVEVHGLPDELAELDRNGVVQAKLSPKLDPFLVCCVLTDELAHRITDEPEQHERQQRHR